MVKLRDFFLRELTAQENTKLSSRVNSNKERDNYKVSLERKKYKTIKALKTLI
jgi:hypothetical protein